MRLCGVEDKALVFQNHSQLATEYQQQGHELSRLASCILYKGTAFKVSWLLGSLHSTQKLLLSRPNCLLSKFTVFSLSSIVGSVVEESVTMENALVKSTVV